VRDDLELIRDPEPGEVRLRVHASGLCHSDLAAMAGQMPAPLPSVLGHEVAGEVLAVGSGVERVRVGDHVVIASVPPCAQCEFCIAGKTNLCVNFKTMFEPKAIHSFADGPAYAFCGVGGFAAETLVSQDAAIVVPATVPYDIACLVGCAVTTGVGAVINEADVAAGDTVAVIGCGGVGMSVILGAVLAGASAIVAVDTSAVKREQALELGATHAVDPADLRALGKAVHGGTGFHVAFEAVGLPATIRAAYDSVRRGGTAVVLGIGAADQTVEFSAYELAWTAKRLVGSTYGSGDVRADFPRLLSLWEAGRLPLDRLITHRHPLSEINAAVAGLRAGEGIRHVLLFDDDPLDGGPIP
jgi:S-(hydroxymethyl)glutathione dehydrogenase/alcohol dehydrogenase